MVYDPISFPSVMTESRPQNYIQRLPAIIDREETDISHLDDRMVEILYPERASKEFTITLVFSSPRIRRGESETQRSERQSKFDKAVALAHKAAGYRVDSSSEPPRHHVRYGVDQVNALLESFTLIEDDPDAEVLVKDKKVPLARELWLPFFWFFVKDANV